MPQHDTASPGQPEGLPPEIHNAEQDASGEQAQDVAEDARREASMASSPLQSIKPRSPGLDPSPGSAGDLIDEMRRMEGEGRIDMSAFAGEPNHDDEPGAYGGETTDDDSYKAVTGERSADAAIEGGPSLGTLLGDVEIPEDDSPDEIEPLPNDDEVLPDDNDRDKNED